ncbi:MAG: GNAT family N-acetyltransferase [Actinobacteria bacterium]|jgi:RimJ/RimL family protein N-acetyltransferase|nr:GNAT family N-acetyltransferase [Actinomycetota bacterium]
MSRITLPPLVDGDLRLRPPSDVDVTAITAACQDPVIQRFTRVPSPYTTDDARAFVRFCNDGLARGSGVHLLAVDPDDDRLLGAIGLGIDRTDHSGELGYWVAPDERGRRVALRGCRLLLTVAFGPLELAYVGLHAAATNTASNALARRLGFTHEGTLRSAMLDGPSGDRTAPRCDANVWGLLPGEWQ